MIGNWELAALVNELVETWRELVDMMLVRNETSSSVIVPTGSFELCQSVSRISWILRCDSPCRHLWNHRYAQGTQGWPKVYSLGRLLGDGISAKVFEAEAHTWHVDQCGSVISDDQWWSVCIMGVPNCANVNFDSTCGCGPGTRPRISLQALADLETTETARKLSRHPQELQGPWW